MASTTEIVEIAKSLAGCKPRETEMMVSFFSDPDNAQAIAEAYDARGSFPPKNRPSYHKGIGFLGRWYDFCDYDPINEFYNDAKVAALFPKVAPNKANCYQIKSALVSLETVKANAMPYDIPYQRAIEKKISEYNALYAALACDQYIIDQEKAQAEAASLRTQKSAAELQAEAFDKASGTTPTAGAKTGTYVLYGFVGLTAIVFLTVMLKKQE